MKTPTINPEFQSLIPPLQPEELAQLEANILADGCRDPLVTWQGVLVDGHNRMAICLKHKLLFEVVEKTFKDENAVKLWIIRNQFGRRNLSSYDRAKLAIKMEPLLEPAIREKAKENQRDHGGTAPGKPLPQKSAGVNHIETRVEMAKIAGVSHDTITKVKRLEAHASPVTLAALARNEISVNEAVQTLFPQKPHVSHNSGNNEWYTPPEFIAAATALMGAIDLDPASSSVANKTVKAKKFFDESDDGLTKEWSGRVWLNPPYAQPLMSNFASAITRKFKEAEISEACILVNNATETAWFQEMLEACFAICMIKARVRFLDVDGHPAGAPLQGQVVIYMGSRKSEFTKEFKKFGPILQHVF